jgi:hypothetical protein
MTRSGRADATLRPRCARAVAALILVLSGAGGGFAAGPPGADSASSAASALASRKPVKASASETGVAWAELSPAQKSFLQPLERDWSSIEAPQKRKWLELATRVPKLSADERQRIQTRMTEWAKLTPDQRGQARIHFQEAKQLPARDRQARWDAYQSLPPEQKERLATRAALAASGSESVRRPPPASARADRLAHDMPQPKSNIVPNPALAAPPKQIGPTLMQARPGATTTLISRPALPPTHQQIGMPKIAATPEFVNKSTLLPQRGPQGAATRPASALPASAATARPATATPASGAEATTRQ